MNPTRLILLVGMAFLVYSPTRASAQPIFGYPKCVDSMAIDCDELVVGTVVDFGDEATIDEFGGCPTTISVEETLKGRHRRQLEIRFLYPRSVLAKWKDQSHRLLVANSRRPTGGVAIDLSSDDLAVLTADLKVLRKPEMIIVAARATIRRMPGVTRIATFQIDIPRSVIAGTKWTENLGVRIAVPVDGRLERRAHEALKSNDYSRRREAAEALRYFKSDDNIARIKDLLADPGWGHLRHPAENRGIAVRFFGVRKEAYETLIYWGIPIEKPAFRETVEDLDAVKHVSLEKEETTAEAIKGLSRFKNLKSLRLSGGELNDAKIKAIKSLQSLKLLELGNAKVDRARIDELRQSRPNLRIVR